ncbi:uncharacterized protein BO88DRAFT_466404 [Aspergillus vadensis CBS 113365]|uniref:Uncharacterized protein n=1 Tax=Aspergillus vadensis (strain CBS 113365 / IMI 142717 / IBT 24658) TaxID=1448311 RepID=A0A319BN22_ASPVC|nr:hypothetical protein BO88DRAFT_466404 [Aspergillus vadensis CBS 113365]PYH67113.1 hypothetical protein BO88DRAFT_466404 [Aspergillus vadensis CBS 113365]
MPPFSSPAVPVPRDLRTLPVSHPQSAAELGLLLTSPNPTPLTSDNEDKNSISSAYLQSPSAGNPIEINIFNNIEKNSNSFLYSLYYSGNNINNPSVLDTIIIVASHTTNIINTVSNSRQQKECGTSSKQ